MMPAKLTMAEVKKTFSDAGCRLLATEYVDCRTKMPFICVCGRKAETAYNNFQQGKRCRGCVGGRLASRFKHDLEYIQKFFADRGCVLLATAYVNSHVKMPYVCICGHRAEINFTNFQQGKRCKHCRSNKVGEGKRHSLRYVQKFFADRGCVLLTTEYKGKDIPMPYICSCGRESVIRFGSFCRGSRCMRCREENASEMYRHDCDFVANVFAERGCVLLATEYKNSKDKLPYLCSCGRIAFVALGGFRV